MNERVYYTILLHIKSGERETFENYEGIALDQLSAYGGKLELRLENPQPSASQPDEVHILSFPSNDHWEQFLADKERKRHTHLRDKSIKKGTVFSAFRKIS